MKKGKNIQKVMIGVCLLLLLVFACKQTSEEDTPVENVQTEQVK